MKSIQQILEEIDRIQPRMTAMDCSATYALDCLKQFILSEPEKKECEHTFKGRFQMEPELSQTTYQCIKCGAIK